MKVISLNACMGVVFEPLMDFIEEHAADTDIFCLQEMMSTKNAKCFFSEKGARTNVLEEIAKRLPDHDCVFSVMEDDFEIDVEKDGESQLGIATFVKKSMKIIGSEEIFIANTRNSFNGKDYATVGHSALRVDVRNGERELSVINAHGRSHPPHKRDAPERIKQSQKILALAERGGTEKIIMGDFNLFPDTESIRMIEDAGFINLITKHEIQTTRGSHIRVLFPEYATGPYGYQEFADYTFISPDITVHEFSVPDVPISDHLPMILTCE